MFADNLAKFKHFCKLPTNAFMLTKAQFTHNIFAHNIEIKNKKIF